MAIFGWIIFSLLAAFGLAMLVCFTIPFVVTETKMMGEKIKRSIADKKFDLEKRSEARKHRDEIKRARDFELANKKLDAKLQKVDKQIEIQQKKLELAKQYKEQTSAEKEELNKKEDDLVIKSEASTVSNDVEIEKVEPKHETTELIIDTDVE